MSGKDSRVKNQQNYVNNKFKNGNKPYGKSFWGKDGKSHRYQRCPQYLQQYCRSSSYGGWSRYCWYPKYGCAGYYCPQSSSWYYWNEPYCCYMPSTCMEQYPPVECDDAVAVDEYEEPCVQEVPVMTSSAPCYNDVCTTDCYPNYGGRNCNTWGNGRGSNCYPQGKGKYGQSGHGPSSKPGQGGGQKGSSKGGSKGRR